MPTKNVRKSPKFRRLPKTPTGQIELLLIQPVEHLGKQGEVVTVRPGYANNFLIPQGLATIATTHHKRMIDKHKSRLAEIQKARVAGLQAVADQIAQLSINIEANANEEGHLYGSVGPLDISKALKERGHTLTPDQVRLTGPLKELGLYTVKIHFGQDVEGELKVWVVPAVSDDGAAPAGS